MSRPRATATAEDPALQLVADLVDEPTPATDPITTGLGLEPIDNATAGDEDTELWSVTTIIGALEKKALVYWSAEETALAAIHNRATWEGMLADDDPECRHTDASKCAVVKWLRDARDRRPKGMRSARELGTDIHTACEQYALTGRRPEVDDEVRPFLDQFDRWLQRFSPVYRATEVTVYHPELGYAGTLDALLSIGDHGSPAIPGTDAVEFIGDYKSTRNVEDSRGQPTKPYPEQVALQLAAYRWAKYAAVWRPRRHERFRRRYYLLSPAERAMAQPVPKVDTGLVIHITPEACEAFPMRCDEEVFEAFLAVQDSARWLYSTSRSVMGEPLVPF